MHKPLSYYVPGRVIVSRNGYSYVLVCHVGKKYRKDFKPQLTPIQMFKLGIFEGKYINDSRNEFPTELYEHAKISDIPNVNINKYRVRSRMDLRDWKNNGWIYGEDKKGWVQWYIRYWLGRRDDEVDNIQINRWKAYVRFLGKSYKGTPKQKQSCIQWAYKPP